MRVGGGGLYVWMNIGKKKKEKNKLKCDTWKIKDKQTDKQAHTNYMEIVIS